MYIIIREEIQKAHNQLQKEVPQYDETLDLFTAKMSEVAQIVRLPVYDVIMFYFLRRLIWKKLK